MLKFNLCIVEGKCHCKVVAFHFSFVHTDARASFALIDVAIANITSYYFIGDRQPDKAPHLIKNRYIVNLFTQDYFVHFTLMFTCLKSSLIWVILC